MQALLVGGAVRDRLLGIEPRERDWLVLGATPAEMIAAGYKPVGRDFPVFLHPETGEEYALARTERKTAPGYHGFTFHTGPEVTLEDDLRRRDLTINAMAETTAGELIDPYGGREDLNNGLLRHVSPAFAEDPVRILRSARFAARFGKWGFKVAHGTHALMQAMVERGEVDALVPERVWAETCKALGEDTPERYFEVLQRCGALARVFPELAPALPAATSASHRGPPRAHALEALAAAAGQQADAPTRWATLLRAGQPDDWPGSRWLEAVDALNQRLRIPKDVHRLAHDVVQHAHELRQAQQLPPDQLHDLLMALGLPRQPRRLAALVIASHTGVAPSDPSSNRNQAAVTSRLGRALDAMAGVSAGDVLTPGLSGPAIGRALRKARIDAIAAADSASASAAGTPS